MNVEAFQKVVLKGYNDTNILKAAIEKYHLTAHEKKRNANSLSKINHQNNNKNNNRSLIRNPEV